GGREMQPDGLILTDVVGPFCESSDAFAKGRRLPLVNRGQNLAIFSAGAYGFAMSSQYNSRPRPAEVLVDGDTVKVLRRRETVEDLMLGEEL
ncbi:MAG: diaminopimelate decarboxylase, partial [Planctomycetes bacterium]|nr:diaminopimelate decarboxylase [Planctomycetota bacterium]